MTSVDGVEDSFDRAIVVERRDRVFVAAIFNLVFDKEESSPEEVDRLLRLLSYAHESIYIWVGGWI